MRLLDRLHAWRKRRRQLRHQARLRKMRVVGCKPDPRCIVRNLREPNR
jgi:hypothetical protein